MRARELTAYLGDLLDRLSLGEDHLGETDAAEAVEVEGEVVRHRDADLIRCAEEPI